MKTLIRNIAFSVVCLLPAVSCFAQDFVFLFNTGLGGPNAEYLKLTCGNHTTETGPYFFNAIYTIHGTDLKCTGGDILKIAVKSDTQNKYYDTCTNKQPAYSTSASNTTFTIDYTGQSSYPYQCF